MYYIYIDESGRGPIAGPVAVGAVVEYTEHRPSLEWLQSVAILGQKKKRGQERAVIDKNLYEIFPVADKTIYVGCCDSKLLSEQQREDIYDTLQKGINTFNNTFYIAFVSAQDIDTYGMTWALRHAIIQIVDQVTDDWSQVVVVVDGPFDFGLRQEKGVTVIPVIDGDAHIPMISAASIFAKVERDRSMIALAKKHPQYGFENHKGYGTKAHYQAIQEYGIIEGVHRKTYVK